MKWLVILLVSLMSFPVQAGWKFLEKETLHGNPLAYPRSPALGFSLNTSRYEKHRVAYFDAILGGQIGVATLYSQDFAAQLGVEAAGWLTLGWRGETSFAMLTEDYTFALPFSFKYKRFIATLKWNHISAHLGDGMSVLLEDKLKGEERREFDFYDDIAEDNDMDLILQEPFAYSRDFFSLLLSYDYRIFSTDMRSYLHIGYAYKILPEELGRWYIGGGHEIKWWNSRHSPYTALDLTWNQDTGNPDISTQVGWMVKPDWNSFTFFVAINGYIGMDRRGQLYGHRCDRIGIGFFVR